MDYTEKKLWEYKRWLVLQPQGTDVLTFKQWLKLLTVKN